MRSLLRPLGRNPLHIAEPDKFTSDDTGRFSDSFPIAWQPCYPIPSIQDLGQWLCAPSFQVVCPFQVLNDISPLFLRRRSSGAFLVSVLFLSRLNLSYILLSGLGHKSRNFHFHLPRCVSGRRR